MWKVRLTPKEIRETYRTRFGIETSYRQMNEARIKTCTRDPTLSAVVRRHCVGAAKCVGVAALQTWPRESGTTSRNCFLELLRFQEMLLWITQVVGRLLRADQAPGIDRETYQRVTRVTAFVPVPRR